MGKLGEEVSQKIKSAIKAKLMELGIHIDNELPDYVMVLVANKKTQQQMEDDLSLFLGESTLTFTSWLHNVLKKLEQVTISTKAKKKEKLRKRGIEHDSNGVSSSKKVKNEHPDEVKAEPKETEPTQKIVSAPVEEDGENDDALSLTDHTEVRNEIVNEPESTSSEVNNTNDNEKPIPEEAKPRERIKIVWDNEKDLDVEDKSSKPRNKKPEREKGKDRRSRSRSRSKNRYSSRKKLRSEEDNERDSSRNRSRDKFSRRQSSSPKRKSSVDRKVVDARDILKRKGADKKMASTKSRRRSSRSPYRRPTRSKSREPVREKQMSSVLNAVIRCPEKPPPTIASLVKVTPRPVRPPSMQPNCNLILKAVADAEKSLATSSVNTKKVGQMTGEAELKDKRYSGSEYSMRNPSSFISHKEGGDALDTKESYEDKSSKIDRKRYDYAIKGNISVTLLNDRVVASKLGVPLDAYPKEEKDLGEVTKFENEPIQEATVEEDTMSMAIDTDDYIDSFEREDQYSMEPPPAPLEEYHPVSHDGDTPDKNTASDNEVENELDTTKPNYEISDDVSSTTVEPVVDSLPKKRKFDLSRLGPIPSSTTTLTTTVTSKKNPPEGLGEVTRCKYWPSCDAGASCLFVHPSSLCRTFPNCTFGDKCLYIHPACKFADKCLNLKCPYAHTSKTPVAKASRPYLPVSNPQLCIYYPNCTKSYCPFVHVKKPCRFGASCMKLGCEFDHGSANRNPYKWVATNQ